MKLITFVTLSFLTAKSFAGTELPSSLHCTSKALFAEAQAFSITHIGSPDTQISIYDASFSDLDNTRGTVRFFFSNECDNSFDILFFQSDLQNLQSGTSSSVTGLLQYSTPGDDYGAIEETVEVTCTK